VRFRLLSRTFCGSPDPKCSQKSSVRRSMQIS
jgi:hypothetical protein